LNESYFKFMVILLHTMPWNPGGVINNNNMAKTIFWILVNNYYSHRQMDTCNRYLTPTYSPMKRQPSFRTFIVTGWKAGPLTPLYRPLQNDAHRSSIQPILL
jgi:hypothetical protein